jgi:hypothetical protein
MNKSRGNSEVARMMQLESRQVSTYLKFLKFDRNLNLKRTKTEVTQVSSMARRCQIILRRFSLFWVLTDGASNKTTNAMEGGSTK